MEHGWVRAGDRSTIFFLDMRKILIRLQLGRGDRVTRRQNIETEGVAGKIFQDRDLAAAEIRRSGMGAFPLGRS
jgi:hypothetical protein